MFIGRQIISRADVGGQHTFFNQPMRIIADGWHDALNLAAFIEHHHGFGGLKINCAALVTGSKQDTEYLIQHFQMRNDAGIKTVIILAWFQAVNCLGHIGICAAGGRVKHRFHKFIVLDFTGEGNRHIAHQRQTVHVRLERTHFVRQCLRQHRNDPARKVNRIAAIAGFTIQRISSFYIVRHICNRNHEAKAGIFAITLSFGINRVIKIFSGLAIDSDKWEVAQIHTAFNVCCGYFLGYFCLNGQYIGRPLMRQIVFAQRNLYLHAGIGIVADNFQHARDRLGLFGWLGDQLNHHHLARRSTTDIAGLNQNILADAFVFSDHKIHAVLNEQPANELGVAALNDFNNRRFAAAAFINTDFAHHGAITVQYFLHLLGAQKQVICAVIRH